MSRGRLAASLALLGVISIALRLPFLSVPLITDEAGYAYIAHWMAHGAVLYRDLWFDRPQGIFLIYRAILSAFGETTEGIRLAAAIWNAGTVLALYVLGRRLFGWRDALFAALLFAIGSASPVIEGFTANGELFMNLLVVGSLLLATAGRAFWAGALLGLAAVTKPTALPTAIPALLACVTWTHCVVTSRSSLTAADGGAGWPGIRRLLSPHLLRGVARPSVICAAGALAAIAPFVAHGLITDAQQYWYAVVGFRVESHSAFSVGASLIDEFAFSAPSVIAALLPVWLLAVVGVLNARRSPGSLVALAFLGGSFLGAAAGGYWYWHYYVGMLPAASLLAGHGLERLASRFSWRTVRGRAWLGTLAASALVALFFNVRLIGASPEETSWNIYRRPAYLWSHTIATYLRAHTTSRDSIYAAFAQADIYFLSGRRNADTHLYWTEINRVPGAYEGLLRRLDDPTKRPKYVIAIDDELEAPGRAAAFWERIESHYQRETNIGPFVIYRLVEERLA